MKSMISFLLVGIFSLTTFAAALVDFDGVTSTSDIYDQNLEMVPMAIPLTPALRQLVIKSFGYDKPEDFCADKDIQRMKFITVKGNVFYAVHTNEDYCDGGNSYGVLLDKDLNPVAWIHDGDFEAYK